MVPSKSIRTNASAVQPQIGQKITLLLQTLVHWSFKLFGVTFLNQEKSLKVHKFTHLHWLYILEMYHSNVIFYAVKE